MGYLCFVRFLVAAQRGPTAGGVISGQRFVDISDDLEEEFRWDTGGP